MLGFLTSAQQMRKDRREYALIRQVGGGDRVIGHQIFCLQTCQCLAHLLCTVLLFVLLFWLFSSNLYFLPKLLHFGSGQLALLGKIGGYACLMQLLHFAVSQIGLRLYARRLLQQNIMDVLRGNE